MRTPDSPRIGQAPVAVQEDLEPRLIWPSSKSVHGKRIASDFLFCPLDRDDIDARDDSNYECCVFWQQVKNSNKLLIFDKHLDVFAIESLGRVISDDSGLKVVKILCGKYLNDDGDFKIAVEALRLKAENEGVSLKLKCELTKFYPYPHDRFAVTDQELWHFGATVGGGYQGQTAVSRGWDDSQAQFSKFFERIFNELGRRRR